MQRLTLANSGDDAPPASGRRPIEAFQSRGLTPKDYAPGRIIAGRYRVEHMLGEGAMGVVVAARHLELDELVAIKFIRAEVQKDTDVTARFAREAKTSARIKSEHVVKLLDVGVTVPIGPYIVMEYLEGKNLCEKLAESGPMQVPRAVECVMQACEALAAAHAIGITHRDIKPENLFLIQRGDLEVVKLLDFGISKAALKGRVFGDELVADTDSSVLGTPLYMSPEQIQNTTAVDYRTDIWSLGVVLYELVTGRTAFEAEDVPKVCSRVLYEQPSPLETHCPDAPAALQAILDRCLQKDPTARYLDIGELALALMPLAPSRARLYAELSASMLRRSGVDVVSRHAATRLEAAASKASTAAPADEQPAPASGAVPAPALAAAEVAGASRASSKRALPVLAALGLSALLGYAALSLRTGSSPAPAPPSVAELGSSAHSASAVAPARNDMVVPSVQVANSVATPAPPEFETQGSDLASRAAAPAPLARGANASRAAKNKPTRASSQREVRAQGQSKRSTAAPRAALERESRAEGPDFEAVVTRIAPEPSVTVPRVTETRRVPLVRDRGTRESDGSRVRLVH